MAQNWDDRTIEYVRDLERRCSELEAALPDPYELEMVAFLMDLLDVVAESDTISLPHPTGEGTVTLAEVIGLHEANHDQAQQNLRHWATRIRELTGEPS